MKKNVMSILLISLLLSSCDKVSTYYKTHVVAGEFIDNEYISPMNTIVSLRMFDDDSFNNVVKGYDDIVKDLSKQMDRYHLYDNMNNIKSINDSCGNDMFLDVSKEMIEILDLGINLTKLSKGKFNIAMGGLIDLYATKFNEEYLEYNTLPDKSLIEKALSCIPSYLDIENVIILDKENNKVKLNKYNDNEVIISLGGIAKGFVMDKAYDYLKEFNYPSLIDAGSSTMATIGLNPTRKDHKWNISLKNPSIDTNFTKQYDLTYLTISLENDNFISTSGDYQQSFLYNDENNNIKLASHILDPSTGYSNNYCRTVTLLSTSKALAILDGCSTAIFNMDSQEQIENFIDLINENYNLDIAYSILKPNNSLDSHLLYTNKKFSNLISSMLANEITKVK